MTRRGSSSTARKNRLLCKLAGETEWVEFKVDRHEPEEIGEYVSALANSAALAGKPFAHVVWGVTDDDHAVVGTHFKPDAEKVGNEELENWLLRLLAPSPLPVSRGVRVLSNPEMSLKRRHVSRG